MDMTPARFDRDYWEDRYGKPGLTWSGAPNPVLISETEHLLPGHALDVGSGEGGDALWLARRGWRVTGIDIAENALEKARARAEAVDAQAAARIEWQQRDLAIWSPEPRMFDLVSSQFMHLAEPTRSALFRALAAAVAPGGTLLIVGHDASDLESGGHTGHMRELMFGVDEVVSAVTGEGLEVQVAEIRLRAGQEPDADRMPGGDDVPDADRMPGAPGHSRDVVVRARRGREIT